MPSYNILNEDCIPAAYADRRKVVSLRQLLLDMHHIQSLTLPDPLALPALMSVLVSIVKRTNQIESAKDLERVWSGGVDSAAISAYLDKHEDRFDLFHPEHPFLQVADLEPGNGEYRSTTALDLRIPSGNNVPFFSAYTDADLLSLAPQKALLKLLVLIGFDTAGMKSAAKGDPQAAAGKTTGNQTGMLGRLGGVTLIGRNLLQTVLLNTPWMPVSNGDSLPWEREVSVEWTSRPALGVLDQLCFLSRRVRLIPDEEGQVRHVVVSAGDRVVPFNPTLEFRTCWRKDKKKDVEEFAAKRWQPGRRAWRGLDGLVALQDESQQTAGVIAQLADLRWLPVTYPVSVQCWGVSYGNMSAVIEDVFHDELPIPLAALRAHENPEVSDALRAVVASADALRQALNRLVNNVRLATGAEEIPWDKGQHLGDTAMAGLALPTYSLLADLQRTPEDAETLLLRWEQSAWSIAWDAANPVLDAAPASTFLGRKNKMSSQEPMRLKTAEGFFRAVVKKTLTRAAQQREERPEE